MDRRMFVRLAGATGLVACAAAPRMALAHVGTSHRFVFIIQRGGADGLAALAPVGDPAFTSMRGSWRETYSSQALIDGIFALHPSLQPVREMFDRGEALFLPAAATAYRDRSHFEAQKVLENGGVRHTGWLNRLLGLLPAGGAGALALASTLPLALSGPNPASCYTASRNRGPSADFLARVGMLYEEDELLHSLWGHASAMRKLAGADLVGGSGRDIGARAAAFLRPQEGARIVAIETDGWDTHASQPLRLANELSQLGALIGALRDGLGPAWQETMVLVATEFGRTVRTNGTNGTDHGTGSLAWLAGGAVRGGRVVGDWPGIARSALFQERDLMPTTSLEGFIGGAVSEHFGLDPALVRRELFPGFSDRFVEGLVA